MPKKEDENKDLTRIEDLSEFLHQEDSDLDTQFEGFSPTISLETLEESSEFESPPEIPMEIEKPVEDEIVEGTTEELAPLEDFTFENNSFGDDSADENLLTGTIDEVESEPAFENSMESSSDAFAFETLLEEAPVPEEEVYTNTSERFEDVKAFANNFSYGQVQGGGNPPYSIIVRHIKFKDEAQDIVDLLKEFGVVTATTEKETLMAIELGSLLIPQISEYTAIVLAHKLRRFDLDLEVGLSDEVHPSRSGESNPKGLIKKDNLRQNISSSLKLTELNTSIEEIIVTTMSSIPGHIVESYIGVQTTFAIVEEAELEKLQYVQRTQRENSELYDFEHTEPSEMTSENAFRNYQNSFALIYDDLTMQLKQKAFAQNANALLGVSFQLSPLNFERSEHRVSAYQITCSATLAIISRENS